MIDMYNEAVRLANGRKLDQAIQLLGEVIHNTEDNDLEQDARTFRKELIDAKKRSGR